MTIAHVYVADTAWDPTHPYFDPVRRSTTRPISKASNITPQKTDKENPKWYMVDLLFSSRTKHLVPLSLLKMIAAAPSDLPAGVEYIGTEGADAISTMPLVGRGRLSVQRVEEEAWNAVVMLADRGGWGEESAKAGKEQGKATNGSKATKGKGKVESDDADADLDTSNEQQLEAKVKKGRKRPANEGNQDEDESTSSTPGPPRIAGRKRSKPTVTDDSESEQPIPVRRSSRLKS
jgi:predicted RNA-binding protein with PUA-like domain